MMDEMTTSFNGMTPVERYLAEMKRPLERRENTEVQVKDGKPDAAASMSGDVDRAP